MMGLDVYLYDHAPENDDDESGRVENDSQKYPEHMFKVGYFRSSYNDGGVNSVLDAAIGETLYSIFDVSDHDEYVIHPNWSESKDRAVAVREKYLKRLEEQAGFVSERVSMPLKLFGDERAVMDAFLRENSKEKDFGNFSSSEGTFFLKTPLTVHGVFVKKGFFKPDIVLVVKRDADWKAEEDWYLKAIDIVIETCEYVLSQPNPESYVFHWSA